MPKMTLIVNRTVTETARYTIDSDDVRRDDSGALDLPATLEAAEYPDEYDTEVESEEVNWTDLREES